MVRSKSSCSRLLSPILEHVEDRTAAIQCSGFQETRVYGWTDTCAMTVALLTKSSRAKKGLPARQSVAEASGNEGSVCIWAIKG